MLAEGRKLGIATWGSPPRAAMALSTHNSVSLLRGQLVEAVNVLGSDMLYGCIGETIQFADGDAWAVLADSRTDEQMSGA